MMCFTFDALLTNLRTYASISFLSNSASLRTIPDHFQPSQMIAKLLPRAPLDDILTIALLPHPILIHFFNPEFSLGESEHPSFMMHGGFREPPFFSSTVPSDRHNCSALEPMLPLHVPTLHLNSLNTLHNRLRCFFKHSLQRRTPLQSSTNLN